jgi:hypothetical protein
MVEGGETEMLRNHFLYYIFQEDIQAHPMSARKAAQIWRRIKLENLKKRGIDRDTKKELPCPGTPGDDTVGERSSGRAKQCH